MRNVEGTGRGKSAEFVELLLQKAPFERVAEEKSEWNRKTDITLGSPAL